MSRRAIPPGMFDSGSPPRARALPIREITVADDEYPDALRRIPDPPERLWISGVDLRTTAPRIGVIGARAATEYGLRVATRLGSDFAASGACVVSGMARGADAAAHDGALRVGGLTIAMLGCGVDVCYPTSSKGLYAVIARTGAIVSPFPPGTPVRRDRFSRRNEILIGVCDALVVVQGHAKSAAVDTGGKARGWGKTVFAVPGCIDWPMSHGVHALIRDGATPCLTAADVLAAVGRELADQPAERPVPATLPLAQRKILEAMAAGATRRDHAIALAGLDVVTGLRAVSALELLGFVRLNGSVLVRIR